MTIAEKRQKVADKYKTILGRNLYSQPRRAYCFKKYSDGKYYSDCSSSIAMAYKECGFPFKYNGSTCPNTVGMYLTTDLVDVDVVIKNGIIQNPEVLRVGDMLLFAGKDSSRKYAGYVGHVEMVYKISGKTITICGHGSGNPSTKNLNTYCKSRYSSKTSTALGHRGLIKVRRLFVEDQTTAEPPSSDTITNTPSGSVSQSESFVTVTGNTVNVRKGPATRFAKLSQPARKGEKYEVVSTKGWTPIEINGAVRWISSMYVGKNGTCTGRTVNVRKGPGKTFSAVGYARNGDKLSVVTTVGWKPIVVDGDVCWISEKYLK